MQQELRALVHHHSYTKNATRSWQNGWYKKMEMIRRNAIHRYQFLLGQLKRYVLKATTMLISKAHHTWIRHPFPLHSFMDPLMELEDLFSGTDTIFSATMVVVVVVDENENALGSTCCRWMVAKHALTHRIDFAGTSIRSGTPVKGAMNG
jgi:hypothetical protein